MKSRFLPAVAVLFAALTLIPRLYAQPLVNIETVLIGDAGNEPDDTRVRLGSVDEGGRPGSVGYPYLMGKYEVTIAQYTAFLNSSAKSDPYGLYNTNMASDLRIAGIARSGSPGSFSYSVIAPSGTMPPGARSPGNRPIAYVSWFDAARFANWLHNGATNGASTEAGAYTLNGATSGVEFVRNPEATWWIPTLDEWYKAAYYKQGWPNAGYWDYPTQSDKSPGFSSIDGTNQANVLGHDNRVGYRTPVVIGWFVQDRNHLTDVGAFSKSPSAYGTYDQGGNLGEWIADATESRWFSPTEPELGWQYKRKVLGGSYISDVFNLNAQRTIGILSNGVGGGSYFDLPSADKWFVGFRLAGACSEPVPAPTPSGTNTPNIAFNLPAKFYCDRDYALEPTSSSSRTNFVYLVGDTNTARVVTFHDGTYINAKRAVPFTLTINCAGDARWAPWQQTYSVNPLKNATRLSFSIKGTAKVGETSKYLVKISRPPGGSGVDPKLAKVASSDSSVVRINDDGTATALARGRVVLTATYDGDDANLASKPVLKTVTVR